MRSILVAAAAAAFTAGIAVAQYKPAQAPSPGSVQATPNPNIQVTYPTAEDELSTARRMPRDEAMKMVKEGKAVYIDVRSKQSYETGHIPGALSFPLSDLPNDMQKLPAHKFLITYCA